MSMTTETNGAADVQNFASQVPAHGKGRRIVLTVLVIVAVLLVLGVSWVYAYNPLAQSWKTSSGEYSSRVINANGIEAHYNTQSPTQPGLPVSTQIWSEPAGRFSVEVETEIINTGAFAVRIDKISLPNLGYKMSGLRVSFFRNTKSGSVAGAVFHPFTLAAHTKKMVVVDYSQQCAPSATAGTFIPGPSGLPVTYSFFDFAHTIYVPVMPFEFQTRQSC